MISEAEDIQPNDERVYSLVRLALASEYHKKGLKREEIFEKVCGSLKKDQVFRIVFKLANEFLEINFGFELVALPVIGGPVSTASASTNKSRKAAVIQNQKAHSSKSLPPQAYTLISTLLPQNRAFLPSTSRDPVRLALIQAILMIISLSGNNVEHNNLFKALNEINLFRDTDTVDFSNDPNFSCKRKDLDPFLEQLRKERYILKVKNEMVENGSIYSWGPRAYLEFPPKNMSEFLFKLATTNNKEEVEVRFKEKAFRVLNQQHLDNNPNTNTSTRTN